MAVTQVRRRKRRIQRVPPLSNLDKESQRAFHQELLDQQALYRQIAAAAHSVAGPVNRNEIRDLEEVEEEETVKPVEPGPQGPKGDPGDPGITAEEAKDLLSKDDKRLRKMLYIAGPLLALLTALLTGGTMSMLGPDEEAPTVTADDQDTQTNAPTIISTEDQLLRALSRGGFDTPDTDLSNTASRVYEIDPELRARHLEELHNEYERGP